VNKSTVPIGSARRVETVIGAQLAMFILYNYF